MCTNVVSTSGVCVCVCVCIHAFFIRFHTSVYIARLLSYNFDSKYSCGFRIEIPTCYVISRIYTLRALFRWLLLGFILEMLEHAKEKCMS